MPEPIYFQWQNEFLLQTIYPLREAKLQDFLLYYNEIETWTKYKQKTTADLQPQVEAYRAEQRKHVTDAFENYRRLSEYLLTADVTGAYRAQFPTPDPEVLRSINEAHALFIRYFPTYRNPAKERYFTAARAGELEALRKRLDLQLRDRQRALRNMGPTWGKKAEAEANVLRWQTIAIPMVEREIGILYAFLAAIERLADLRKTWQVDQAGKEQQRSALLAQQQTIAATVDTQQAALQKARRVVARYQKADDLAAQRAYFTNPDVSPLLNSAFPGLSAEVIQTINRLHQTFAQLFARQTTPAAQRGFIGQRMVELEPFRKTKASELAGKQRALGWTALGAPQRPALDAAIRQLSANLAAVEEELALLQDFAWAYDRQTKPAQEASLLRNKAQAEVTTLENSLRAARSEAAAKAAQIETLQKALNVPEKDALLALAAAATITVSDIARGEVEQYRAALLAKTIPQLLEEIVQRFVHEPQRYPLWLQYMVIHFSGMRYQSAHGSWADPKQLLLSLRIKALQGDLKSKEQEAVAALCEQKWLCYKTVTGGPATLGSEAGTLPALAATKDPQWLERITRHVRALDPARGDARPKALLDLRIDEEEFSVEQMPPQQALDELEALCGTLPDWLSKEIIRLTDLRLKLVKDLDWEQVALNDPDRYRREMLGYQQALTEWKRSNLTGWREEHERTNQLIVTRAVCNEVAEHIQHLRGHKPPGGLTAKPEWYLRAERDPRLAGLETRPYLRKPKAAADFHPGASILWLRWVRKEPNAWQVTVPITLNNGEELIPVINDSRQSITNTGKSFQRVVTTRDAAGGEHRASEWLRWMHEATVVDVAETADGPTVLTFETARPDDDRRQSSIGLFKHSLANLRYLVSADVMNATFTGYLPEASVPYDDLKEMLDWNHILLRQAYTPAQMESFWRAVVHPPEMEVSFGSMFAEECDVEAAPVIDLEKLVLYEASQDGMRVYTPEVDLPRGARFTISKSDVQEEGGVRYLLITGCAVEPRAEGLYARADELIEIVEPSLRLAQAKRYAPLFRLVRIDESGHPVFQKAGRTLRAGVQVGLSTVHHAGTTAPASGLVRGRRGAGCWLIARCDAQPDRQGLFVRPGDLESTEPAAP